MIFATLVAAAAFGFAPNTVHRFDVDVQFKGFLPLFGGREGEARVKILARAAGVDAKEKGNFAVESEIEEFSVEMNGNELPFTKDNVQSYFPKAVAEFKTNGEMVRNEAPKVGMPVRLPGLDSQRFPEVSYLPIQLPSDDVEEGKSYRFDKSFGGAPVKYVAKVEALTEETIKISFKLNQEFDSFENGFGNPVPTEKDASRKVSTILSGEGTGEFSRKARVFQTFTVTAVSRSKVFDLKKPNNAPTERSLKNVLTIKLKS